MLIAWVKSVWLDLSCLKIKASEKDLLYNEPLAHYSVMRSSAANSP